MIYLKLNSIALHFFSIFYPETTLECFCCLSHFLLVIILKLVLLGCVCVDTTSYYVVKRRRKLRGNYGLFAPMSNPSMDVDLDIMY